VCLHEAWMEVEKDAVVLTIRAEKSRIRVPKGSAS
jgi:hypothetical protein